MITPKGDKRLNLFTTNEILAQQYVSNSGKNNGGVQVNDFYQESQDKFWGGGFDSQMNGGQDNSGHVNLSHKFFQTDFSPCKYTL